MNSPPAGVRQREEEKKKEQDYILCQIRGLLFDYGFYMDGRNGLMMDIQKRELNVNLK